MKQFVRALCGVMFAGLLFNSPARADEAGRIMAGDLVITQAWTRATPGGAKVGGGYVTIENKGTTGDRLIGARADSAEKVQLHEMTTKDGVMTMRPVEDGLVIEPGKIVKLAPGGYHLMLLGLKFPLRQGEKIGVTLEFERAGEVGVPFLVEGVGAKGPPNPDD